MIELRGLTRIFRTPTGPVRAVDGLDLDVPAGSFTTLLGPSGCGKSTTLRMVAGLERPDAGTIRIDGTTVFAAAEGIDVPAHRRGLGMVFQSFAVWPHLDVAANVAYPLHARHEPRDTIAPRVEEALALVGLGGMGRRRTTELSGGQQQRVAIARALVARPAVLLLDEPLSNLDARLRQEIRAQLLDLRAALGITVLFVTHDRIEALTMSDQVIVMAEGRVRAAGTPEHLHDRPGSADVARLLGAANVLPGVWHSAGDGGTGTVRTALGPIPVAGGGPASGPGSGAGSGVGSAAGFSAGEACAVVIRRDAIRVTALDAEASEALPGRVVRREFRGEASDLIVDVAGVVLRVAARRGDPVPAPGSAVAVHLDPDGCRVVRP